MKMDSNNELLQERDATPPLLKFKLFGNGNCGYILISKAAVNFTYHPRALSACNDFLERGK